jgi:RNA recognition motif-containing protein
MNGTQEHVADASSDTVSAAAVAAAAAAASVAAPAPVAAPVAVPTDSLTAVQKDPDALKLFIGQLPKAMSEAEVKDIFAPFGPIAEFMILKDKFTGTSKGCGFVTFAKRESAKEAMSALHEQMTLPGMQNQLQVKLADSETRDDQRKLFVGMLPKASTEEYLKQLFTPYGEVEDIYIMKHPDGQGKGCAFVKFAAASSATAAIAAMHQRMTLEGCVANDCQVCRDGAREECKANGTAADAAAAPNAADGTARHGWRI